jgi:hypothetical protein
VIDEPAHSLSIQIQFREFDLGVIPQIAQAVIAEVWPVLIAGRLQIIQDAA